MKKFIKFAALFLSLTIALTACGGNKDSKKSSEAGNNTNTVKRSSIAEHEGKVIDGGVLKIGLVTDSPFTGIFNDLFSTNADDMELFDYMAEYPSKDGDGRWLEEDELRKVDFDKDNKKVTITIKDTFKWSDGTPVTSRDYLFGYEIVGHPEYTGVRYDVKYQNVVGMEEYHNGEAETISGIETPDDKTIVISFKEFLPNILWGEGIMEVPQPYHYLGDVPVKDMISNDKIRINPLSSGAFVITNVIPGERVEYKVNEHYYKDVKIDGIEIERVPVSNVLASLKSGKYDLLNAIPGDIKNEELDDLSGYSVIQRAGRSLGLIGFKLGTWDNEKGEVNTDPNAKMANVNLRKAMGYALDIDAVGEKFYQGLAFRANSVTLPRFVNLYNPDAEKYTYDPKKAEALLDEAGYKDVDGDGLREDPNGEKLTINYAAMSGGEVAEPVATAYLQWWKAIGLDVQLLDGRLHEMNSFYERLQTDDPEIDVYFMYWSLGTSPNPTQFYDKTAAFNFTRYTDENMDKALEDINGEASFDNEHMKKAFDDFDKAIFDAAPIIPATFNEARFVVNKRIKYYDWSIVDKDGNLNNFGEADVELTAEEPIK
ncbi:oligopeptide ABC transporter substrate-binding protein [Miniphocaeibacter halophilus]|uniref:Oligopeptide ABC transporter substrate-binding protein n=1 Tax=Miniphocaeibacter halophilus TaxID=2931922 RepID=A0AC61MTI1_9FIRM|nr:oligopeptide ABC transporter substrate-binding protein [Miniphocaeibacter halophilus]QQK09039.1 oligopeptide ABC transporter substrate-binding protein [Miniphocaeibacter halophilus]